MTARSLAAAALAALAVAAPARAADPGGLPWLHDDYEAALARARDTDRPLVVDLWAPWCHTCLSMKQHVFPDPSVVALADRFVWLALDTDKPENAKALETLTPEVWPTFYVLAPDGTLEARHGGALSIEGFRDLLARGERSARDKAALAPGTPLYLLREGDRLAAGKDYAAADRAWAAALAAAPADWARAPEVLVRRLRALVRQEAWGACADLALAELPRAVRNRDASAGDFGLYANLCAGKVNSGRLARKVRRALVGRRGSLREAVDATPTAMSPDDRSDALATLREVYTALGRDRAAREAAEAQAALLDEAVKASPTLYAQMTWGWPRAEVYVWLGRGAEVVPWLAGLAEALPDEYDPPYRLAWVLHQLGRDAEALPAAERAHALAYGPRKERIAALLAEIRGRLEARP